MLSRTLLSVMLLAGPVMLQSADECKRCDCSTYPQPSDTCTKCCFILNGIISAKSEGSVTVTPSLPEPKPVPRTFRLPPHTPIKGNLNVGENATVYYHNVDGQDVATRIELTDYIEGQLTPDSLPTPTDNQCSSADVPAGATRVLLGNSGAVALGYPFVPLKVDGTDLITIQKTKQGMLVSAKLFDSHGQLAAQIVDNHFFANVKGAAHLEISPNHHSLKIFDGESILVDIQFMNPNTLRILGTLYGPFGTNIDVSPDEFRFNGRGHFSSICASGSRVGFHFESKPSPPINQR
jgi:hypothetical protein